MQIKQVKNRFHIHDVRHISNHTMIFRDEAAIRTHIAEMTKMTDAYFKKEAELVPATPEK